MTNKIEFITDRLVLRPIEEKDAEALFKYRSDSITNQYQGWIPESVEDANNLINRVSPEFDIAGTWFQFVIIEKNSQEIIGDLGVHFLDAENKQAEIGFTLDKNWHGKGFATEALKALVSYLFDELNKHRIIASIDPRNIKSIDLLDRLGFRKEAHFKECIFIKGEWLDDLVYAVLKKEWK